MTWHISHGVLVLLPGLRGYRDVHVSTGSLGHVLKASAQVTYGLGRRNMLRLSRNTYTRVYFGGWFSFYKKLYSGYHNLGGSSEWTTVFTLSRCLLLASPGSFKAISAAINAAIDAAAADKFSNKFQ